MEIDKPDLHMTMDDEPEKEAEEVTLDYLLVRQYEAIQAIEWKLDTVLVVLGGVAETAGLVDMYEQMQTILHASYEGRDKACTCEPCKEKNEGETPHGQPSNSYYPE